MNWQTVTAPTMVVLRDRTYTLGAGDLVLGEPKAPIAFSYFNLDRQCWRMVFGGSDSGEDVGIVDSFYEDAP